MATWPQRLIREKIEVTPGTAVATTAADAILCMNVTERNLEADYAEQNFARGIEGAQPEDLSKIGAGADYDVEAAPPATVGVAPLYGHLLQSSGWAMAMDDTDAVYTPMDPNATIPSCTMMMKNGAIQQVISGVRSSMSFTAEAGSRPFFRFTRRGRYQAPVAHVQEAHNFESWPRALEATPENMFAFTLGGTKLCCKSFNFTDGRSVSFDKYMNCDSVILGPRKLTGRMTVKWPAFATKDLLTQIRTGVTEPLIWTLGTVAGKTLQISAPKVQIKWAGEQEIDGDLGINLDLVFLPNVLNDEIEIRFQ